MTDGRQGPMMPPAPFPKGIGTSTLLQTLRVFAIGIMLSSLTMILLRLSRVSKTQGIAARGHRYLPWIWWSLVVLVVTGVALVIGNPRSSRDPALAAKLLLMVPATVVTLVLALMMRDGDRLEERAKGRMTMSVAATGTLELWLGVTFLGRGRWIFNFLG
jgi:uncharacterized membrane protein